jgi:predicted secreted protein
MLWRKAAATTAITVVLFAIVYVIAEYELISLQDLAIEL